MACRRGLVLMVLLVLPMLAIPTALAQTTTSTICYGGEPDRHARALDADRIVGATGAGTSDLAPAYWVTTTGWPIWEETNGKRGLQQTDEVCTERTIDENGVIVSSRSWVETPADTRVEG